MSTRRRSLPIIIPLAEDHAEAHEDTDDISIKKGIDFLAPGAEIRTVWGTGPQVMESLRERQLEDGIAITSRYKSLTGEQHETEWRINPLLVEYMTESREKDTKDLVKAVERIGKELNKAVSTAHRELRVST